jgi:hypothetical protein
MVVGEFFQGVFFTEFMYPFLLVFFILFAVLEKTKVLGESKQQLNALISLVVSLIFVSAVMPKIIVGNLVLIMSVAIVMIFVIMVIWGFVGGDITISNDNVKNGIGIGVTLILILVVLGMAGFLGPLGNVFTSIWSFLDSVFGFLFTSSWSGTFWGNAMFLIIAAGAIWWAIKSGGSS